VELSGVRSSGERAERNLGGGTEVSFVSGESI
jgi:hypothetical protein